MRQPVSSPRTTELRRRRAADEILIAAIYGLSEREDEPAHTPVMPRLVRHATLGGGVQTRLKSAADLAG